MSRSASSKRFNINIPTPSPIIIPLESLSNGLGTSSVVNAGVLLKFKYIKGELSVSTPPVIIILALYSNKSAIAIFMAAKEPAQAASTTQFVPPKSKRFATRPAITLPNMPGKEFSTQGI